MLRGRSVKMGMGHYEPNTIRAWSAGVLFRWACALARPSRLGMPRAGCHRDKQPKMRWHRAAQRIAHQPPRARGNTFQNRQNLARSGRLDARVSRAEARLDVSNDIGSSQFNKLIVLKEYDHLRDVGTNELFEFTIGNVSG